MSKCYLLFAEGFEECEGLVTLDILRRAGLEAYTVSIQDAHTVVGAHGVPITCDRTLPELLAAPPELVVLPGGMPGTTNLAKSPAVEALVRRTLEHGGRAAAVLERPAHERLHGRALGQIRRARHAAREHDKLRRRCQQLRQRAVARDGHAVRADDGVCVLNGHRVCLQAGAAEDVERDETLALLKPLGKQQIAF